MSDPIAQANTKQKRRAAKQANRSRPEGRKILELVENEPSRKHRPASKKPVEPLNAAQRHYDSNIHSGIVTFGIGPAGTGKTWFAAARAAQALRDGEIEKIVVTRPAVEAGENLGFLPGEMDEKYEPYFRPVRDALEEILGTGAMEYHLRTGNIEARPLAFLRGASIANTWLIADEMQNATVTQMKLLLTRIGERSKFIINGDPDQCDLPGNHTSGLMDAVSRLSKVKGIGVTTFDENDIVRSGICQDIVIAYGRRTPREDRYTADNDEGLQRILNAS